MSSLAGQWIGTVYGTNHGNAFMELEDSDEGLKGTIRFNEPSVGIVIYSVSVESGDTIRLHLSPQVAPNGVELMPGQGVAILQTDGSLSGRWETEAGTAGTFQLNRHNALTRVDRQPSRPEQVFFHTASVGAVRLYNADLNRLVGVIGQDFVQAEPIVTYVENGVQVTKFMSAFLSAPPVQPLKSFKISIQEPESSGLVRLVHVDLIEGAGSQVRTSGTNESWVTGKAHTVRAVVAGHENKLVSWYRRYGLTINSVIFLVLLVAAPEVEEWPERAGLVAVVFGLLTVLALIYNKFVPNTLVFASDKKPSWWTRAWPTVLSWFAAVTSSLVAMWVFWLFTSS